MPRFVAVITFLKRIIVTNSAFEGPHFLVENNIGLPIVQASVSKYRHIQVQI